MTNKTLPAWEQADPSVHADDPRALAFRSAYPVQPIPAQGPVVTETICSTPSTGFGDLWQAIEPETRTRANDIHLPVVAAYPPASAMPTPRPTGNW